MKIPVLTGIGHERDNTILDEVANIRFDTPSKVIAGIEQVIQKRVEEAKANFDFLTQSAHQVIDASRNQIDHRFGAIQTGAIRQVSMAKRVAAEWINELHLDAIKTVHEAKQETRTLVADVRHGVHQQLADAKREVPAYFVEIRSEVGTALRTARTLTRVKVDTIHDRAAMDLTRSREMVQQALREVAACARRVIVGARVTSTTLFREVAGQGPEKTLGRGFAIARNELGRPVTSVTGAPAGASLELEFRDGRVATQVK